MELPTSKFPSRLAVINEPSIFATMMTLGLDAAATEPIPKDAARINNPAGWGMFMRVPCWEITGPRHELTALSVFHKFMIEEARR